VFKMPCYSPLKGWRDEFTGGILFKATGGSATMEVACGQCLGCRLDHSRMWAMRCVHEASLYDFNCFITLTYRSEVESSVKQFTNGLYVPSDWSLHRSHFVKFMKRLRKNSGHKIRYFMAGEYGRCCQHGIDVERVGCPLCVVGRPHYHALLFGYMPSDLVLYAEDAGVRRYTSEFLTETWRYGFVDVGEVTFASAAYVARYCLKKVRGLAAQDYYWQSGLDGEVTFIEPEYCTMSRKPGIGAKWFEQFHRDVFPADEVPVPGHGLMRPVPRYYESLFEKMNPVLLQEVKEKRAEWLVENADSLSPDRLMAKYLVKQAQLRSLKRKLG
jgi:hypothetical protein